MNFLVKNLLATFSLFVLGFSLLAPQAQASDLRALKLAKFLRDRGSVLQSEATTFVTAADKYQLDYRLLAAISGVESTFARNYVQGSYNAYGWGGGWIFFQSWPDGIEKISQGLQENYINKGATDVEDISWIYCPPGNLIWARKVRYFMNQIENVEIEENQHLLASALPLTL